MNHTSLNIAGPSERSAPGDTDRPIPPPRGATSAAMRTAPHTSVRTEARAAGGFTDKSDKPLTSGYIGLQMNQGLVKFRNLFLRPLGTKELFNGKDLSNWTIYVDPKTKGYAPESSSNPEYAELEPNDAPAQARLLPAPSGISGRIGAAGDSDLVAFDARRGDRLTIETPSHQNR